MKLFWRILRLEWVGRVEDDEAEKAIPDAF